MAHSNSSLNQFLQCEKMYDLNYNKHLTPPTPPSIHLSFGTMAHEVLYKAGELRDTQGLNPPPDYKTIIPSEIAYPNEAAYFKITSWHKYFVPIIKKIAEIEQNCIEDLASTNKSPTTIQIEREIKLSLTPDELSSYGLLSPSLPVPVQPLVGVIDLLLYNPHEAIILDYKFSTKRKDQDDFDMNSQLYIYALFVHLHYDIPLHNIRIGYIDIPKQMFEWPIVLSTGMLSRSKAQNCSQDMYIAAVRALHDGPGEADKLLAPGGYYHDIVNELALNQPAYLSIQYIDETIYANVINDIIQTAQMITLKDINNLPYLRKHDSYSCKNCDWKTLCKPYLTEVFDDGK